MSPTQSNRSSPLLSAEAAFRRLVLQPSGTMRQLTSALMPTAPARLPASLQVLHSFACSTLLQIPADSLDPAHKWPTPCDILSESRSGSRTFNGEAVTVGSLKMFRSQNLAVPPLHIFCQFTTIECIQVVVGYLDIFVFEELVLAL